MNKQKIQKIIKKELKSIALNNTYTLHHFYVILFEIPFLMLLVMIIDYVNTVTSKRKEHKKEKEIENFKFRDEGFKDLEVD